MTKIICDRCGETVQSKAIVTLDRNTGSPYAQWREPSIFDLCDKCAELFLVFMTLKEKVK